MSTFFYTALDKKNTFTKGKIEAKNVKKAVDQLEKEGFLIVNIRQEKSQKHFNVKNIFNNVTRLDKIFFTSHLYTLLESGVPLDQAIKITAEQTDNKKLREILIDIHQTIQKGRPFNEALSQHGQYFSKFFISAIKTGEKSGKLDEVLSYLLEQQEKDYELLTRTRTAFIYPSVIISAMLVIVTFMMLFVVPKIIAVFSEYDVKLPIATRILIGLSRFITNYGLWLIPLIVLLGYFIRKWSKTPRGKKQWDSWLLKIGPLAKIIVGFNLARLTRALSVLLKSGLPIDEALDLSADMSNNSLYRQSFKSGIGFIQKGIPLAEVLRGYPQLYPSMTVRTIEIGEKSGKLDHMLSRLAIFYEKSVITIISNLAALIEPILLIAIGLAVAFVAIALLTPIWNFSQVIN